MIRNVFLCLKETEYNGVRYRAGDAWDEDGPTTPPYGEFWTIRGHVEVVVPDASTSVRWVSQPDRPRAAPPTPEELEVERLDPYGLKTHSYGERPGPAPPQVPIEQPAPKEEEDPGHAKFNEAARLRMEEVYRLAAEDDARAAAEKAADRASPEDPPEELSSLLTGPLQEDPADSD